MERRARLGKGPLLWMCAALVLSSGAGCAPSRPSVAPLRPQSSSPAHEDGEGSGSNGNDHGSKGNYQGSDQHHHQSSGQQQPSGPAGSSSGVGATTACPGNPLLGVYHPYRLHVLAPCRWYRGTVSTVRGEEDGDYHVDVEPDPGFRHFLTHDNFTIQNGALVTEIMAGQHLPIPSTGERVAVFGTWVLDTEHGWNEIHPIWAIRYLGRGTFVHDRPPVPPRYDPDASSGSGSGSGGSGGGGSSGAGSYLPPPHDYDCADFPTQKAAQGYFNRYSGDPSGLDGDNDGIACEDNP